MSMLKFMEFYNTIISKVDSLSDTGVCEGDYSHNFEFRIETIYRFESFINLHKWSQVDSMKSYRLGFMIFNNINRSDGTETLYVEIEYSDQKTNILSVQFSPDDPLPNYEDTAKELLKTIDKYVEELKDFK